MKEFSVMKKNDNNVKTKKKNCSEISDLNQKKGLNQINKKLNFFKKMYMQKYEEKCTCKDSGNVYVKKGVVRVSALNNYKDICTFSPYVLLPYPHESYLFFVNLAPMP